MIRLRLQHRDGTELLYKSFIFSGGEIQVRLPEVDAARIVIQAKLRTAHDIIELLMVTDAIRRGAPGAELHLVCPYLPYARQDRVCAPGEAFGLEVMCKLINVQQYTTVTVWDVHSKVSTRLLSNVINLPASYLMPASIIGDSVLVSPDKGAVDRVTECAKKFNKPMVIAEKIRNPDDGKITHTEVHSEHIGERSFLIVDDICDGGATFIELAKVLRPLTNGKVNLWVTHGIFFKGFEVFEGLIDNIYTANCFRTDVPDFVHVISQGQ